MGLYILVKYKQSNKTKTVCEIILLDLLQNIKCQVISFNFRLICAISNNRRGSKDSKKLNQTKNSNALCANLINLTCRRNNILCTRRCNVRLSWLITPMQILTAIKNNLSGLEQLKEKTTDQ